MALVSIIINPTGRICKKKTRGEYSPRAEESKKRERLSAIDLAAQPGEDTRQRGGCSGAHGAEARRALEAGHLHGGGDAGTGGGVMPIAMDGQAPWPWVVVHDG